MSQITYLYFYKLSSQFRLPLPSFVVTSFVIVANISPLDTGYWATKNPNENICHFPGFCKPDHSRFSSLPCGRAGKLEAYVFLSSRSKEADEPTAVFSSHPIPKSQSNKEFEDKHHKAINGNSLSTQHEGHLNFPYKCQLVTSRY